jgi:predicted RNA binding protein YcfA (HicA-like mRNA interferase family)
VKFRELTGIVERDGWVLVHTVGSHRQYKHPTKRGKVTIAGKPNQDVHPKMLGSVLRQAGLK